MAELYTVPSCTFETVSSTVIQPRSGISAVETRTPLSIADAKCLSWDRAAAVWLVDAPSTGQRSFHDLSTVNLMQEALRITLEAYRPWCGTMMPRAHTTDPKTGFVYGFGRLELVNNASDPGVHFEIAKHNAKLDDIVPSASQRRASNTPVSVKNVDSLPFHPDPDCPNPFKIGEPKGKHVVSIKLTLLACGGAALAVKVSHACADAHSVSRFAQDWAAVSRALFAGQTPPSPTPLFASRRVDDLAGDIDGPEVDPLRAQVFKELSKISFDPWIGAPEQVPAELRNDKRSAQAMGTPVPFADMAFDLPKAHYLLHFSAEQMQKLWEKASNSGAIPLTRLNALNAHMWTLINRARGLDNRDGDRYLSYTIGLRRRIEPLLGDDFIGCSLVLTTPSVKSRDMSGPNALSNTALALNRQNKLYTHQKIGDMLHTLGHEQFPGRLMNFMFGKTHTTTVSWCHEGVNDVDFGLGRLRLARMCSPAVDGYFHVMEAPPDDKAGGDRWDRHGVEVSMFLAEGVMEKFLADPLLFP